MNVWWDFDIFKHALAFLLYDCQLLIFLSNSWCSDTIWDSFFFLFLLVLVLFLWLKFHDCISDDVLGAFLVLLCTDTFLPAEESASGVQCGCISLYVLGKIKTRWLFIFWAWFDWRYIITCSLQRILGLKYLLKWLLRCRPPHWHWCHHWMASLLHAQLLGHKVDSWTNAFNLLLGSSRLWSYSRRASV